jgi:endonuclease III
MPGFWKTVAQLESHYGRPPLPSTRDPFALILYENIAYLASDDRREKAFRELKTRVGLRPADILTTPLDRLAEITAMGGIFAELRARRLQESARLVRDEFGGNLILALAVGPVQARKALQKFPVIGEPGVWLLSPMVCACWPGSALSRNTRITRPCIGPRALRSKANVERIALD